MNQRIDVRWRTNERNIFVLYILTFINDLSRTD